MLTVDDGWVQVVGGPLRSGPQETGTDQISDARRRDVVRGVLRACVVGWWWGDGGQRGMAVGPMSRIGALQRRLGRLGACVRADIWARFIQVQSIYTRPTKLTVPKYHRSLDSTAGP
jgi:hypothetical protein